MVWYSMVYFIPMRRRGIEETAVDTHPKSMHITRFQPYLDEVELPVLIAAFDLKSFFPGHCGSDGFHAVAVRGHDVWMHNRGGQRSLRYRLLTAAPTTVLAEDNGLVGQAWRVGRV